MAKLDLSALKKQKISTDTPVVAISNPMLSSQNETVETPAPLITIAEIQPVATTSLPLVSSHKEPEIMRAFENPHRPKLSLSNFKKPGAVAASSTPAVVVVEATPVLPAVQELPVISTPIWASTETISLEQSMSTVTQEMSIDSASPLTTSTEAAIVTHWETITIGDSEPVITTTEAIQEESKIEIWNKEFFPNLEFENDNLFDDIVEMGSFGEEKKEEISTIDTVISTVAASEVVVMENKNALEENIETVALENSTSPSVEIVSAEALSVDVTVPVIVTMEELATQSNEEMIAEKGNVSAPPVQIDTVEYVDTVAKDLSKNRKGGLSELFEKKKKVFYGVGALMLTSVFALGGLSTLWIIDFSWTKASVSEVPRVVAVNVPVEPPVTVPEEQLPEVPDPFFVDTDVLTPSGTTATSTGEALYPPIVVTSSGTSMAIVGTGAFIPPRGRGSLKSTGSTLSGSWVTAPATNSGSQVIASAWTGGTIFGTGSTVSTGSGTSVIPTQTGSTTTTQSWATVTTSTGTIIPSSTPGSTINTFRTPNIKSKKRQ